MPRACSRRSVKTWPRSGSAQSWISSTATNSASRSSGMASTVQENQRASGGTIFSSPVIRATWRAPLLGDHAVVVLARQQAEREADDAGGVGQQPLDGEMRLAGVGRAEDGLDARGESGHGRDGWGSAERIASGLRGRLTVRSWLGCYRWRMPTVLRVDGLRFYFYSQDRKEPTHIHVDRGGSSAKTW